MRASLTQYLMQQPSEQSIQQLRDQIRENVRQQLQAEAQRTAREAQRAAQNAQNEHQGGVPAPPPPPDVPRIVIEKDGKQVIIGPDGDPMHVMPGVAGVPRSMDGIIPREAVIISIAFFIMVAVIAIGLPLARAIARRMDRRTAGPAIPADLGEQLRRLENAVETMAVEVERISEGQRFSAGLLREMHPIVQRAQGAAAPALLDRTENGDNR
jgi:hypothetical protein